MSSSQNDIIIETRNLTGEVVNNGIKIRTVDSFSYRFRKGSIYNIVGPSGAGKSSLLRLLNRLDNPAGGEVLFLCKPLPLYQPTDLRRKVSMLFQTPYLFPGTVKSNLEYCLSQNRSIDINFQLSRVGLKSEFAGKDADNLSVGEKQRVAIARSLILEPDVLLLDEPTSALDPTTSKKIEELILSLSAELNLTIIIVTHRPAQALRLGGRTLLMVAGKLIETGETSDVLTNPQTELCKKYINRELI